MKYLFSMPVSGPLGTPDSMTSLAGQADRLGFEAITASERLVMPRAISSSYPYAETGEVPGVGTVQNTLEMLTVLAFLSAHTARIGLLTSVLVLPYRNLLLTAKMLATIDVLSKGRLIVGCGVGWMREEADTLGVPSAFEDRGAVSDEYIRAFRELWSGDEPDFQGRHLRFSDIEFAPRPVQQPGPPIWIGGESPAAMRRVATLGDGWLPAAGNPRYPLWIRRNGWRTWWRACVATQRPRIEIPQRSISDTVELPGSTAIRTGCPVERESPSPEATSRWRRTLRRTSGWGSPICR